VKNFLGKGRNLAKGQLTSKATRGVGSSPSPNEPTTRDIFPLLRGEKKFLAAAKNSQVGLVEYLTNRTKSNIFIGEGSAKTLGEKAQTGPPIQKKKKGASGFKGGLKRMRRLGGPALPKNAGVEKKTPSARPAKTGASGGKHIATQSSAA